MHNIGAATMWAIHPDALANVTRSAFWDGLTPNLPALFRSEARFSAQRISGPVRQRDGMVVLPIEGVLRPSDTTEDIGTERLADIILTAGHDRHTSMIVLKIMSPGGLVWGTQELGDAIFKVRQIKPIVAVADKFAFSAAHWIATQASAFYASPSAQVGSVGVRTAHADLSRLQAKLGIKTTLIASNPKKIAAHSYAPLTDEDRAEIEADLAEMNGEFVKAIARGRGISVSQVAGIHGTGQVFSSARAAKRGITDGILTLREVVAKYASVRARTELMRDAAERG